MNFFLFKIFPYICKYNIKKNMNKERETKYVSETLSLIDKKKFKDGSFLIAGPFSFKGLWIDCKYKIKVEI